MWNRFHKRPLIGLPIYPQLLLSGANDPVTPPEYGDLALSQLRNATHIVVSGTAHNTIHHPCVYEMVTDFYQELSPQTLETKCASDLNVLLLSFLLQGQHHDNSRECCQVFWRCTRSSIGIIYGFGWTDYWSIGSQWGREIHHYSDDVWTIDPRYRTVDVDGFDPSRQPVEARKCLGALPDAYGLYPRLTAREIHRIFWAITGDEQSVGESPD